MTRPDPSKRERRSCPCDHNTIPCSRWLRSGWRCVRCNTWFKTNPERCECGFAGTDITPDASCGCCGKLVDERSMRWLVEQALSNFKQKETHEQDR